MDDGLRYLDYNVMWKHQVHVTCSLPSGVEMIDVRLRETEETLLVQLVRPEFAPAVALSSLC